MAASAVPGELRRQLGGIGMFRQVVVQTWAESVTDGDKDAMIGALIALERIPELVSVRAGADEGFFAGNWGFAAVLDFPGFEAARRYVGHPDHQAFIAGYAAPLTDHRAVVQYEWGQGSLVGCHHLTVPVADLARSQQWYSSVLGFEPDPEFTDNGQQPGTGLYHPVAGLRLALRQDSERAAALAGFDLAALAVGTREDLADVAEHARAAGSEPGPLQEGHGGWTCDLTDPDGMIVRLHALERHT